jgi:hypothetical protein
MVRDSSKCAAPSVEKGKKGVNVFIGRTPRNAHLKRKAYTEICRLDALLIIVMKAYQCVDG